LDYSDFHFRRIVFKKISIINANQELKTVNKFVNKKEI
jgi:hypothetical protein